MSHHGHVNPYLLTLPQLISAKKKLGVVAANYDAKYSMSGFDVETLDPSQFREQLRRNFFVNLTDAELGALVVLFDREGTGRVHSVDFIREFFNMGKQEKIKMRLAHKEEMKKIQEQRIKHFEKRKELFHGLVATRTTDKYTPDDLLSAKSKLATIAFTYNDSKGELEKFLTSVTLSAVEMRELIRRNFLLKLTPAETAAFFAFLEPNEEGRIDCRRFVFEFLNLGKVERSRHTRKQQEIVATRKQMEIDRVADINERFGKLVVARMEPATEADKASAFEKIRYAASCYKVDDKFGSVKNAFDTEEISPTELKEVLKLNFQIYLTPGELDAVVKMFDTHGTGRITCSGFLFTMNRLNLEDRSKQLAATRAINERIRQTELQTERKLLAKLEESCKTKVVWPVLPSEDDPDGVQVEYITSISSKNSPNKLPPLAGGSNTFSRPHSPATSGKPGSSEGVGAGQSQMSEQSFEPDVDASRSSVSSKRKSRKKVSHVEIIGPALMLNSRSGTTPQPSYADLYPRASADTKAFLREMEEHEREIMAMKVPKSISICELSTKSVSTTSKIEKSMKQTSTGGKKNTSELGSTVSASGGNVSPDRNAAGRAVDTAGWSKSEGAFDDLSLHGSTVEFNGSDFPDATPYTPFANTSQENGFGSDIPDSDMPYTPFGDTASLTNDL